MLKSTWKMAAMVEEAVRRGLRRERVFRDRANPLDAYCDTELRKRYRFSHRGCIYLVHVDLLHVELEHPTGRSRAGIFCIGGPLNYYRDGARGQHCLDVKGHTSGNQGPIS